MDQTLTNFIAALRNADVRISMAETLDAFGTIELIGYRDRQMLKHSLALTLPKTVDEKERYDECFDEFFAFQAFDSDAANASKFDPSENDTQSDDAPESESESGQSGGRPGGKGGGGGSGAEASDESHPDDEHLPQGDLAEPVSELGQQLMANDRTALTMAMASAAEQANVHEIQVFTQKGLYTRRIMEAMGLDPLNEEIEQGANSGELPSRRLSRELRRRRDALREQVRDHVERQFLLHADADGLRLREEMLRNVKLSNIEHRNFRLIQTIVFKMAKKLATMHAHRRKITKRGQLNLPRTLRSNMSYDGAIFKLKWKSVKIDRPRVFTICDVSGSVANYARFMLMFLYSLETVLPKVRSFAFSSDLAEVTQLFEQNDLEQAITRTLHDYGGGSTDYGQAFADFHSRCLDQLDKRTTVIILGDARNNFGEARTELLKDIYDRCQRVIWLNPEARNSWGLGDSEMRRYAAYCHQVEVCNSLTHLERLVGNLLKLSR